MPENKIGQDVLGQGGLPQGGLSSEQRVKLRKKLEEEKRRKQMAGQELNGKEIHEEGPSDQHEPKPQEGFDLNEQRNVAVKAHKRGRPNRKSKE